MPMEKTFDAHEAEPRIYAAWEKAGAFRAGANAKRPETFCIMIPPPNVTGALHMGHAFNNTLQDILTRWHRMRGFDTLWQPGTDHAGIATQMVVERELAKEGNTSRREMGREAFVARVWQQKVKSRTNIIRPAPAPGRLLRLEPRGLHHVGRSRRAGGRGGQLPRRRHPRLRRPLQQGLHLPRQAAGELGPPFRDAISDLEVEQVEVEGHMWRLRYPLETARPTNTRPPSTRTATRPNGRPATI
jgi:valyl-tRNA synthetase